MKTILILILAYGCGIPPLAPLPPLGCSELRPVCTCDGNRNCYWQFVCVE